MPLDRRRAALHASRGGRGSGRRGRAAAFAYLRRLIDQSGGFVSRSELEAFVVTVGDAFVTMTDSSGSPHAVVAPLLLASPE